MGAVVRGVLLICVLLGCVSGRAEAGAADGCRPLRAIFYASSGSLTLAAGLAADASPCAQYFVSVPPLAADKTQMRSGTASQIRALGVNFHALAEVNVTAWQGWVTSTGNSWYQAGVEARNRMVAAGFVMGAGDSWAINELSSAVRAGTGTSRQNIRDLAHGLYDGGGPSTKGVVFVEGISQPTSSLATYKANLESWLQDTGFWGDMSSYVSDFLQENYGDVRDYGVAGADVPTRLSYLNAYLEHVLQLATTAPSTALAAQAYLEATYAPLANAAWAWSSGFGYTAVRYDQMEDYVSAQVDAMRSYDASLGWSADRIGFAWDPSNSLGLSPTDFSTQTAALLTRMAAAIQTSADPAAPGAGACQSPWCTATIDGAAFTPAWSTFSTWTPTSAAFGSSPETVTAGAATGPMNLRPQIGGIVTALPIDTVAQLSSSSAGGSFSTSPTGPWTPTLDLTIPAHSTSATFYMLDSQPGTPTVTATIGGESTTQVEVVTAPAAPLVLANGGSTVTFAEGGIPVTVDPALTVTDSESTTLVSATVAISAGFSPGDVLAANTTGTGITASYSAGTLTLSGSDTLADYQTVLQSINFAGTSTNGSSRTILWTVNDGTTTASAVSTVTYTAPPSAPTGAAASAGDGQATVSFDAPASNGGTTITSYTVTSSPGGLTASGTGSPITVTGLTNGTGYTFTVTATNAAGTGPASVPSNAVTPTVGASGGGSSGGGSSGGGGGGGGGSSSLALTVSPPSQTIASGSAATWTISVTNTGGAYLYAVGINDALARSCGSPSAYSDTLSFMAPNVTVTYTCSLNGVTANFTNTVVASATTGPGPTISTTATAAVTVQAALTPPPSAPVSVASPTRVSGGSRGFATLVVSRLKTIVLDTSKPKLSLTVKVSKGTTLVLTLLGSKGHKLAGWIERERTGSHKLSLLLPLTARHKGHDTLRITETGDSRPRTFPVTLTRLTGRGASERNSAA